MPTPVGDHSYPYQKLQSLKALIGSRLTALLLRRGDIGDGTVWAYEDFVVELRSDEEVILLHLANGWFTPPELPGMGHLNLTLRAFNLEEISLDTPSDARAEYESVTKPLGVRYAAFDELGKLADVQVSEAHENRPLADPEAAEPATYDIRSVASITLLFTDGATLVMTSAADRVTITRLPGPDPAAGTGDAERETATIRVSAIAS